MANDIIVSEMTSASQINTNDLMIMTQPDLQAETGYSTKKGTVLQVANKMLKGTEYLTDLPDFTDKTVLGGLEELKGDLTALLPVDTASGAIANFDTDLTLPLVDCKANIVATGGNGTPDNPNPINGYSSANITRCGVNLFDVDGWLTSLGVTYTKTDNTYSFTASSATYNNAFVVSSVDRPITLSVKNITGTATNVRLQILNSSNTVVESCYANETKTATGCKVRVNYSSSGTTDIEKPQIVLGSTPIAYHAYNGQTYAIAFGQTVYGGVLDLTTGVLTITWGKLTLSDIDNWQDRNNGIFSANISSLLTYKSDYSVSVKCEIYAYEGTTTAVVNMQAKPDLCICLYYNSSFPNDKIIYVKDTNYDGNLTDFVNSLSGKILIAELATPQTYQLTPVQINALLGVNNVYNDTNGDTEVKYKEGIQHYIDKKIAATQALIL